MKKIIFSLIACAFLFSLAMSVHAQGKNFAGVMPFLSSSGRLGFFDQNTGKVYVYDANFNACMFEGQVQELGKNITKIQGTETMPKPDLLPVIPMKGEK